MKYSPSDFLHLYENTTTKAQRLDYFFMQGKDFMDAPATLRDSIAIVNLQRKTGLEIDTNIFDEDIEFGVVDYPDDSRPVDCEGHVWANDGCVTGEEQVPGRTVWDDTESEDEF